MERKIALNAVELFLKLYITTHNSFIKDLFFLYDEEPQVSQLALPLEPIPGVQFYYEDSDTPLPNCVIALTAELSDRRVSIFKRAKYVVSDEAIEILNEIIAIQTEDELKTTTIGYKKDQQDEIRDFVALLPGPYAK